MEQVPEIAAGRSCGKCTLCCKVLAIEEAETGKDEWCKKCNIGKGCSVYDERPFLCRAFVCGYLGSEFIADHWFPAKCKMVIVSELDGARIAIHVDASYPGRWRHEPYYSDIRELAAQAAANGSHVLVCIGFRAIAVFPNNEIDLGTIDKDERIVVGQRADGSGVAFTLHKDDPKIAGKSSGALTTSIFDK